ncbi:putative bifunctional diguanylate cyclase/phosphodiesterase [Sphingomonas sp.]|jgi:diguanylate cyclase (GGDEF)-like protein|uniref:putative bifunctional diguanylate cyclase/phosphodiesterase n=1 Tax=Sphingomonas sp. TaxID=28214 RepID=UPI002E3163B7|nr:EAL domain-containing protein [Sphingomonas sp.]HEX4695879.1 EAL domain-containing protein [Sphingomonas sp.]
MESASLKGRAITFALCAGVVVFVLAVLATSHGALSLDNLERALIPAIVCAVFSWAAAERAIGTTAAALDTAIERLAKAAHGDLDSPVPAEIATVAPHLSQAMEGLFRQVATNLDSVHRLAMYDPVTSLPNRTHFRRAAERQLAEMPAGTVAALLFIDLDRFKAVNDTKGHATGDMLLGMVANRLRAVADGVSLAPGSGVPLIGRLAGDEFTMLFPKLADAREAARIGRGVLFALTEPFDLAGTEIEIGASIGIAMRPTHGTTLHDLMRAADAAMYHAKASGRGRTEHFSDELAAQLADRAQLEVDLRSAIERGQFELVYQPQVSLRDGRTVAAEALLRWRHPTQGIKLPASFLERAEESGLIVEIGEWVIAEVAGTLRRWAVASIDQRLAINVSQRQLDHAMFFRRLREAMHAAQAPARLLELEITETLAMHCSDDVIEAISALRADGATIAIDGYGTGHSSLSRLRELPIDRIKLDHSLVAQITEDGEARQIAQSVVGLIHGLGCEAVAEGIERAEQEDMLRVIGCDVVQGYAVAAPMDEAAFIAWSRGGGGQSAAVRV